MRELKFFDANCRVGFSCNGGSGVAGTAELLREMDYYGVDRALVRDANIPKGALTANATIAQVVAGGKGRLVGVWCMLPSQCGEIPEPDEFFAQMKAAGIGALTLSPFEHHYIPCRLTIGRMMKAAAERKIPVLLDAFANKFKEMYDFAAEFPDNILLYQELWGKWGSDRFIRPLLENYPNFYFETAGYWVPEGVRDLVELYGAERILYGSGYPVFNHGAEMPMLKSQLDDAALRLVAGGNLERLLKEAQL